MGWISYLGLTKIQSTILMSRVSFSGKTHVGKIYCIPTNLSLAKSHTSDSASCTSILTLTWKPSIWELRNMFRNKVVQRYCINKPYSSVYTFSYIIGFGYVTVEIETNCSFIDHYLSLIMQAVKWMYYVTTLAPNACIIIFLKMPSAEFYSWWWSLWIRIFGAVSEKIFILIFGTHLEGLYLSS